MNLELKLSYEEDGQTKALAMTLEMSGEKETAYSLQTAVGDVVVSFRPKPTENGFVEQFEPKKTDVGFPDFNTELRKMMEERNVFAPKHRSRK